MKTDVQKEKPEPASNKTAWAFDLGKGSIGEAKQLESSGM